MLKSPSRTRRTSLQIGLDPDGIDYDAPEFAQFKGLSVRLVAINTLLFESILNLAHSMLPATRFVFNYAAQSTPDDIRRWYPTPDATAPVR